MQQYKMRDYCNTFTILKISCLKHQSPRNLFDDTINGLPLKLCGAVCLSSAKLLRIIFSYLNCTNYSKFLFLHPKSKTGKQKNHQEDKGTMVLECHHRGQSLEKQ
jgi:hypothetical protein